MKRKIYDDMLQWKKALWRKPLLMRGARQVGKTWLLKEFGRNEFRKLHYVNFENAVEFAYLFQDGLRPTSVLNQLAILLDKDIDTARDLVIFDEIQNSPQALTSLKYFNEEMKELAVCAAGSHIGLTLSEAAFPVGQVDFLSLHPMTFEEFLWASDPRAAEVLREFNKETVIPEALHMRLWKQLKTYYVTGGLPEVVECYRIRKGNLYDSLREVRRIQVALVQGYQSDFAKHAGKTNADHINRVFGNVPVQMSRSLDENVGKFRFKGIIPDKSKFSQLEGPIDWLVKAGLVLKVNIVEKPELPLKSFSKENTFKLYLFDVGVLGCMLDLPFDAILNQDYGSYKGYYAENFVAQEFTAVGVLPLYSWRGRQSEVEFLRVLNGRIVPVEVKAGTRARSKSLAVYAEKYGPDMKIKITARNLDRRNMEYHNYPLYLAGKIISSQ